MTLKHKGLKYSQQTENITQCSIPSGAMKIYIAAKILKVDPLHQLTLHLIKSVLIVYLISC